MTAATPRSVAAVALLILVGCDVYSCAYKTDPPEPFPVAHLETEYETEDGRFTLVLHSDAEWPPTVGVTSFTIEWIPPDPDPPVAPHLEVERPFLPDLDLVAVDTPSVEAIDARSWRIGNVTLDTEGRWVVPVVMTLADVVDSIELGIAVEAP